MAAGLDRAEIGRRRGARRLVAGLLVGSVVGVGGCTTGGQGPPGTPSPTAETPVGTPSPSPTSPSPVDPLPTLDGVIVPELADLPLEEWRFTADELGSFTAAELWLVEPTHPHIPNCCNPLRTVIDAAETWVIGAHTPDGDPAYPYRMLVGLSPESGDLRWTFGPPDAQPVACAEQLLDGDLACLVEDQGGATWVAFLDPATGDELDRFAVGAGSALAVAGSDVFTIAARYTRSGTPVWSESFTTGDDVGAQDDSWQRIAVTAHFVIADVNGVIRVYDHDTGALVVDRGTGGFRVTDDGHLVLRLSDPVTGERRVDVMRPDGTLDPFPSGMRWLGAAVRGVDSPMLLMDGDGQIHTFDVGSGDTAATGITPAPETGSELVWGASVVGETLVVSYRSELQGYDMSEPGTDTRWTSPFRWFGGAFTDGERVFALELGGLVEGRATAIDLATGEIAWQLERAAQALAMVRGQLLAVQRDAITLLAPDTSPIGNFEAARTVAGGIEVRGWAIDPDTTDPIYVWVTVDDVGRHLHANVNRPDVAGVYPAFGPDHGFRGVVPAGSGTRRVCVTASNVAVGGHELLGCRTVAVLP